MIEIESKDEQKLTFIPKGIGKIPESKCVYFLCSGRNVTYIGQTKNLKRRIQEHSCLSSFKDFDSIGYIEISNLDDRLIFETETTEKYLYFLYPPYARDYKREVLDKVFE